MAECATEEAELRDAFTMDTVRVRTLLPTSALLGLPQQLPDPRLDATLGAEHRTLDLPIPSPGDPEKWEDDSSMARVIPFPQKRRAADITLTYKQLANHLGISERFIRARVAEGMPASWNWSGRKRVFNLGEVEEWLRRRQEQRGR